MKWIYLKSIDSTNNFAKRLIKNNKITTDTVIIAEKQSRGKGTKGRKWYSDDPGGLYFSYIAINQIQISKDPKNFVLNIGKEIAKALGDSSKENIYLEWPNDLMINKKKCGGILTEYYKKDNEYIIIGIGININQSNFPANLKYSATSLKIENQKEYNIINIVKTLSEQINNYLNKR